MSRFYDPKTGTEALDGIHELSGTTSIEDMPEPSRQWFSEEPIPDGMKWENDPTGKYPVLVPIPPPTDEQKAAAARNWARSQLRATDFIILPDSPYTDAEREQVRLYREALRNPTRDVQRATFDDNWRPPWPKNVKVPDGVDIEG